MPNSQTALTHVRLDSLTSLRWWAAFAVFGQHILNLAAFPAVATACMGFGHLGVTFFFILFSGNPAAWTLTVEAFFYALHPFISQGLRRLRLRGALIGVAAIILFTFGLRALIVAGSPAGNAPWPVLHLYEFVLGMFLAWAMRHGWLPRIPLLIPALGLFGWFTFVLAGTRATALAPLAAALTPYSGEIITDLFATLIVSAAGRDIQGRTGWLGWRPLVALGERSFAFYLIHSAIIYTAREVWGYQSASLLVTAALCRRKPLRRRGAGQESSARRARYQRTAPQRAPTEGP